MITKEQLAELRRLEAEATPGKCRTETDDRTPARIQIVCDRTDKLGRSTRIARIQTPRDHAEADAALIVALRNAASDLIEAAEERERLRAKVDELIGELARFEQLGPYEAGVLAVRRIRCHLHYKIQQYNANESTGGECAACEIESLRSDRDRLAEEKERLKAEVERLQKREDLLCALEGAGVDNWEGYGEAFEMWEEEK